MRAPAARAKGRALTTRRQQDEAPATGVEVEAVTIRLMGRADLVEAATRRLVEADVGIRITGTAPMRGRERGVRVYGVVISEP